MRASLILKRRHPAGRQPWHSLGSEEDRHWPGAAVDEMWYVLVIILPTGQGAHIDGHCRHTVLVVTTTKACYVNVGKCHGLVGIYAEYAIAQALLHFLEQILEVTSVQWPREAPGSEGFGHASTESVSEKGSNSWCKERDLQSQWVLVLVLTGTCNFMVCDCRLLVTGVRHPEEVSQDNSVTLSRTSPYSYVSSLRDPVRKQVNPNGNPREHLHALHFTNTEKDSDKCLTFQSRHK